MKIVFLNKLKNWTGKQLEIALNLIYPQRCPFCDGIVSLSTKGICDSCHDKITIIREPRCRKCGKPIENMREEYCKDCNNHSHDFDRGFSLLLYQNFTKESIYRYKYKNRREYADCYAKLIVYHFNREIRDMHPDALIPVPLYWKKQRKRGFNQAGLLAEKIKSQTGIPVNHGLVIRTRNTKAQKALNRSEREKNLKKAFQVTENDVKLDTVIVIDDIYTTGSTVDMIARELKKSGVKKVYFLTLASGSDR